MTVIRLKAGRLLIHSPCEIDSQTKAEIADLGPTAFIVAPGTYHYLHVISCQKAFPDAKTFLCPGIERKRPKIPFDGILDGNTQPEWDAELDQVLVEGSRFIWEVAFLHRASRTLILVDLIENIGDSTPGTNSVSRFFWKVVFRMWNRPRRLERQDSRQPVTVTYSLVGFRASPHRAWRTDRHRCQRNPAQGVARCVGWLKKGAGHQGIDVPHRYTLFPLLRRCSLLSN